MEKIFNIFTLIFFILLIPMLIFAPWIPTRKKDISRIIDLAGISEKDTVYDLGSGDGKVLFGIADKINCTLIGIDTYLPLYLFCIIKKWLFYRDKNISFKLGNFFSYNLSNASVIYIFGLEGKMDKLAAKIEKDCSVGTKVISYAFEFPTWENVKKDKPTDKDLTMYVYEIK